MARPLRIEFPGALYHVISRGNAKQNIYFKDEDRILFLDNLEYCIDIHNLICHAYCLMNNHYHLLLETPDGNLSPAMRDINGNYSQSLNYRYNSSGHLFQDRYKAYVIEKETYFLEVARYIVNNPLKHKFVNHPKKWHWSNYNAIIGSTNAQHWLQTNFTLKLFADDQASAQAEYQKFVGRWKIGESPYDEIGNKMILGSTQFVDSVWEIIKGSESNIEIPVDQRIVGRPTLAELFTDVGDIQTRDAAIVMARKRCGYLNTEIARHLKINNSTVGKIINGTYYKKNPLSRPDPKRLC